MRPIMDNFSAYLHSGFTIYIFQSGRKTVSVFVCNHRWMWRRRWRSSRGEGVPGGNASVPSCWWPPSRASRRLHYLHHWVRSYGPTTQTSAQPPETGLVISLTSNGFIPEHFSFSPFGEIMLADTYNKYMYFVYFFPPHEECKSMLDIGR